MTSSLRKSGNTAAEAVVGILVLVVFGLFVLGTIYQAWYKANCEHGYERPTGRLTCLTTGNLSTCEPETEFVCQD